MPLAARRRRRTIAAVGGAVVVAHGINRRGDRRGCLRCPVWTWTACCSKRFRRSRRSLVHRHHRDAAAGRAETIIGLMFIGRIGPITMASALALRERRKLVRLPEERAIVG
jgi:hypothetical protein